jgi:hypothetical protein
MSRRVYVSSPVAGFDASTYERVLSIFRARGAEVVSSRALFPGGQEWARGFRDALKSCTDLLILLGSDRVIGTGVLREIAEARALGLDVWFAQPNGAVRPAHGVWLRFLPGRSSRRAAIVNFEPRRRREEGGDAS